MIQRVQTIFLFLAALAMTLMLFFDVWTKQNAATAEVATLNVYEFVYSKQAQAVGQQNTIYIAGLVFLSVVLACTSIFSFRSRMRQLMINLVNNIVMVATFGICFYLAMHGNKTFATPAEGAFGVAMFMPPIAIIMNMLANHFIRKDEKLVRSVDRLR